MQFEPATTAIQVRDGVGGWDAEQTPERSVNASGLTPRVALMFPGQGAQYPGMASRLHEQEPVFRAALERALDLVAANGASAARGLVLAHDGVAAAKALRATGMAQPAIFAVEFALFELLRDWGVRPFACIGHSVGEIAAATAAGLFTLEDAARFVTLRGALMQKLPEGAMISVDASPAILASCLGAGVDLAAINAPNQYVLSGPDALISEIETMLVAEGFAARRLHTSHAFHSAMMAPVLAPLEAALADAPFGSLSASLVSNITGRVTDASEVGSASYWARHVRSPVRFAAGLETILSLQPDVLIEVGPGRSLSALARRCGADRAGLRILPMLPGAQEEASDLIGQLRAALEVI